MKSRQFVRCAVVFMAGLVMSAFARSAENVAAEIMTREAVEEGRPVEMDPDAAALARDLLRDYGDIDKPIDLAPVVAGKPEDSASESVQPSIVEEIEQPAADVFSAGDEGTAPAGESQEPMVDKAEIERRIDERFSAALADMEERLADMLPSTVEAGAPGGVSGGGIEMTDEEVARVARLEDLRVLEEISSVVELLKKLDEEREATLELMRQTPGNERLMMALVKIGVPARGGAASALDPQTEERLSTMTAMLRSLQSDQRELAQGIGQDTQARAEQVIEVIQTPVAAVDEPEQPLVRGGRFEGAQSRATFEIDAATNDFAIVFVGSEFDFQGKTLRLLKVQKYEETDDPRSVYVEWEDTDSGEVFAQIWPKI